MKADAAVRPGDESALARLRRNVRQLPLAHSDPLPLGKPYTTNRRAIEDFAAAYIPAAKPFVWRKTRGEGTSTVQHYGLTYRK
jgi:hypothetical protein